MDLKELIVIPNVADKLKCPPKTDKRLGPNKDTWCEFHQAFGHSLRNFLALGFQLDELVRNDFLKEYLQNNQGTPTTAVPTGDQGHEIPVHGEINMIFGGFLGGGCIASQQKKYVREVMAVEGGELDQSLEPDLFFTKAEIRDVVPHDNDPVVISVVTAGRKVHRVLIDQFVMFWSTSDNNQV